jgi:thioredoxin 1
MVEEKVIQVTDADFDQEVLNSELPVLVDCWAAWCTPCLIVGPIVQELAHEYEGKVKVCKLNVDEGRSIAARYGIMSIPTLFIFKNGQVVDQVIGAVPKEHLSSRLDQVLTK